MYRFFNSSLSAAAAPAKRPATATAVPAKKPNELSVYIQHLNDLLEIKPPDFPEWEQVGDQFGRQYQCTVSAEQAELYEGFLKKYGIEYEKKGVGDNRRILLVQALERYKKSINEVLYFSFTVFLNCMGCIELSPGFENALKFSPKSEIFRFHDAHRTPSAEFYPGEQILDPDPNVPRHLYFPKNPPRTWNGLTVITSGKRNSHHRELGRFFRIEFSSFDMLADLVRESPCVRLNFAASNALNTTLKQELVQFPAPIVSIIVDYSKGGLLNVKVRNFLKRKFNESWCKLTVEDIKQIMQMIPPDELQQIANFQGIQSQASSHIKRVRW